MAVEQRCAGHRRLRAPYSRHGRTPFAIHLMATMVPDVRCARNGSATDFRDRVLTPCRLSDERSGSAVDATADIRAKRGRLRDTTATDGLPCPPQRTTFVLCEVQSGRRRHLRRLFLEIRPPRQVEGRKQRTKPLPTATYRPPASHPTAVAARASRASWRRPFAKQMTNALTPTTWMTERDSDSPSRGPGPLGSDLLMSRRGDHRPGRWGTTQLQSVLH